MVNTRSLNLRTYPYVLPSQCEQVFYSEVPGRGGCSFVIRHDPRGKSVKYNVEEYQEGIEEDDVLEDKRELDDHVREEDVEELVKPDDVGENVHEYDIDETLLIELLTCIGILYKLVFNFNYFIL
jgi:hypothetical protein